MLTLDKLYFEGLPLQTTDQQTDPDLPCLLALLVSVVNGSSTSVRYPACNDVRHGPCCHHMWNGLVLLWVRAIAIVLDSEGHAIASHHSSMSLSKTAKAKCGLDSAIFVKPPPPTATAVMLEKHCSLDVRTRKVVVLLASIMHFSWGQEWPQHKVKVGIRVVSVVAFYHWLGKGVSKVFPK